MLYNVYNISTILLKVSKEIIVNIPTFSVQALQAYNIVDNGVTNNSIIIITIKLFLIIIIQFMNTE